MRFHLARGSSLFALALYRHCGPDCCRLLGARLFAVRRSLCHSPHGFEQSDSERRAAEPEIVSLARPAALAQL